jgi:hypothetical protein
MTIGKRLRGGLSLIALGALAVASIGCGELTIRTWVTIIEEDSSGYIQLHMPEPLPPRPPDQLENLQGGMLTAVQLDTRDLLGTMTGLLTLEDVRIAGLSPTLVGPLCTWNDPEGDSSGTFTMNLLGGTSETTLFLDAKAYDSVSKVFGLDPVDVETDVDFDLGGALDITAFLGAFNAGTVEGMFATQTSLVSSMEVLGMDADFAIDITLDNGPTPPLFDADLLSFCGEYFDQQGTALFHGLNSKSSYLLAEGDDPVEPLVVSLAELGAAPGDTLRLTAVGTYADSTLFRDGDETRVAGVFSATDTVLPPGEDVRIPDAIDAGEDYETPHYWTCILLLCLPIPATDIPEDFRIDPEVDVVVPDGAQYLIMAPIDRDLEYEENSGLGFGVDIEVNPGT